MVMRHHPYHEQNGSAHGLFLVFGGVYTFQCFCPDVCIGGVYTFQCFCSYVCTIITSCRSVCGVADVRFPTCVTYKFTAQDRSADASVQARLGRARLGICDTAVLNMTVH